MAGEAEWRIGWPNTAQYRVAAEMGAWDKADTGVL
jgi:hypothetical protein